MHKLLLVLFILVCTQLSAASTKVRVGSEQLIEGDSFKLLKGKRIGLVTNHTAISSRMVSTVQLLKSNAQRGNYTVAAFFAPEHGLRGIAYAGENIADEKDPDGIPVHSLHGTTRRPTEAMLKDLDLILYDIQDIGSRSYTFVNTLFFVMEEAAKRDIPVIVLDRPNPINGLMVDGPMLEEKKRSILGYINVPYCHGMTVGELALFFNSEYKVGCKLTVIPMKGWNRRMTFSDTGLAWVPTSPNIPEATTAYFYPATGILGELSMVNIGIGYTMPFKLVGAPWIQAQNFVDALNKQKLAGVHFEPFYYRPFYGKYAHEDCQGALIVITQREQYRPVTTQYMIMGILKSLYPKEFKNGLIAAKGRQDIFGKVNGTDEVFRILSDVPHIVWPLRTLNLKEREAFLLTRQKYLLDEYDES